MISIYGNNGFDYFKTNTDQQLKPGEVVQLTEINNQIGIARCDGIVPFGILLNSSIFDATVKFGRHTGQTTMYDTAAFYSVNANLYVMHGLLTTTRYSPLHPSVGMVIEPPSPYNNITLKYLWL